MAKEFALIILCIVVWGSKLVKKCVLFQYDNLSLVQALKKGSAKDYLVMQMLHRLWFFVAYYDVELACIHITGAANTTADHLSRNSQYNC